MRFEMRNNSSSTCVATLLAVLAGLLLSVAWISIPAPITQRTAPAWPAPVTKAAWRHGESADNKQAGGDVTFVPLHTYYISPTGDDKNPGTTSVAAWATPRHAVDCGDVIIVAAGNYTSQFGTANWGIVSNCPSKIGGVDGTGGIYFAVVLCGGADMAACSVNGGDAEGFRVDASNWAAEGFIATQRSTATGACYSATSETNTTLHHIAFINDIASNCDYAGFDTYAWTSPGGVDQTAVVGVISYNGAPSTGGGGICGSGVSLIPVDGPDTSPGTHIFVAGYFGYNNINAPAGAGCNTDGEGLIFDSWACTNYTHQGVAEQNVWWHNGNSGFEVFPNCSGVNGDKSQVYIFNNTSYGNEQDPRHLGAASELYINQVLPTAADNAYYSAFNNIFVANTATSGSNGITPVYAAGFYLNNGSLSLVHGRNNQFWQSSPGTTTTAGHPNTDVFVSGSHDANSFPFGVNTYADPEFANPFGLPTAAPDCGGYTNTTACMNERYKVSANLYPRGSAAGLGYQPPSTCAADPYFPVWLKGVVYLKWNGFEVTEHTGLVTKPCDL